MNAIVSAPNFPATTTSIPQLLNCFRVLSRLIPYIFESPECSEWEDKMFWVPRSVERIPEPPTTNNTAQGEGDEQPVKK